MIKTIPFHLAIFHYCWTWAECSKYNSLMNGIQIIIAAEIIFAGMVVSFKTKEWAATAAALARERIRASLPILFSICSCKWAALSCKCTYLYAQTAVGHSLCHPLCHCRGAVSDSRSLPASWRNSSREGKETRQMSSLRSSKNVTSVTLPFSLLPNSCPYQWSAPSPCSQLTLVNKKTSAFPFPSQIIALSAIVSKID